MAKAQFHKNQRVYVLPVGAWALVERVIPHWTKGLEKPIRIAYDVGLGREFSVEELQAETTAPPVGTEGEERWRIVRASNKFQSAGETAAHPYPGTFPTVITGESDWGGWRVPGAEYAVAPNRVEEQARLIVVAPRLAAIVKKLYEWSRTSPGEVPNSLRTLVHESKEAVAYLKDGTE